MCSAVCIVNIVAIAKKLFFKQIHKLEGNCYLYSITHSCIGDNIMNCFKSEWSLPKLILPLISITGKWGFNPPRVPTFGISWYKYGGILQGARIIGSLGDKYIGAGEAGPEAVLPLHSFYSELRNIIAELVDRNAGPTEFNQFNSYYSPKDLSPAECARKTRDETRQLLKNVKRA